MITIYMKDGTEEECETTEEAALIIENHFSESGEIPHDSIQEELPDGSVVEYGASWSVVVERM